MEGEKHGLKDKRQVKEHKRECWFGEKKNSKKFSVTGELRLRKKYKEVSLRR